MRYAYNGEPLWCYKPSPIEGELVNIPKCECCGSSRAFEIQIMPGLLQLDLEPQSKISTSTSISYDNMLDFGVVCIYSCKTSCPSGEKEVIVVQPSIDSSILAAIGF